MRCCDIILQEMETIMLKDLKVLLTREWLGQMGYSACTAIVETTGDYRHTALTYLKKHLLHHVLYSWHKRILAYYLRGLLGRCKPIKLASDVDRSTCAEQLRAEALMLNREFESYDDITSEHAVEYHFDLLSGFADILEQADAESIMFDIATVAKHYPSLNADQLVQMVLLRGDLSKKEAREKVNAALESVKHINHGIMYELVEIVQQLRV